MVVLSLLVALYYNMIVAWVFFYFGSSFTSQLPWSNCRNEWNTYRKIDVYFVSLFISQTLLQKNRLMVLF